MASGEDRPTATPPRAPGRPRLYEPDAERDRILAATLEVLKRSAGEEATVADILEEAGLSTRAFYRHFETKEDVVRTLYERDSQSFGAHLRRYVEAAADPPEALMVWVSELLGIAYDRRRAERASALSSPMVLRVVAGTPAQQLGRGLLVQPLREVLEAGLAAGHFPDAIPDVDVYTIWAVTWEAVGWARSGVVRLSRREACDQVLRFCRAGLGVRA